MTTVEERRVPSPRPAASAAAIVARGITHDFGSGVHALRGVDLDVHAGSVVALLGRNGAGKTTLVRALCTLLTPTSGTATVAGLDIGAQAGEIRKVIGAAMQSAALDDSLTGREHLVLAGRLHGMSKKASGARADALLERFGLGEFGSRRVGGYSGGLRRRLDIAVTLVHDPAVLFLDEPTVALDLQSRLAVWQIVRELRAEGRAILLTTHDMDEAQSLADEIAIIHHGRIEHRGSPAGLRAEAGRTQVELAFTVLPSPGRIGVLAGGAPATTDGTTVVLHPGDGLAEITAMLGRAAELPAPPTDVRIARPTLEEVFLRLTREEAPAAPEAVVTTESAAAQAGEWA